MVYIKRIELSHFKSFGGTTPVPLLPGFTVISGPNGSGKSNILDALLFCLGLAGSKGLRAERLPDLINNQHRERSSEANVSVTFDISDIPEGDKTEWTVSRRLKVAKNGNYTSTYYIDGEPRTVTELHEQLNRLRIYPEGYNVVLQGDVTRIITMNPKERREIIDELAGVAEFDRKIEKTKDNIESVKEREERCQIIATELERSLERLALDRVKAEKYQKLKALFQEKQLQETVLIFQQLEQRYSKIQKEITAGEGETLRLNEEINALTSEIGRSETALQELNRRVKALGEEEHLSLSSELATARAKRQQLQQRLGELEKLDRDYKNELERLNLSLLDYRAGIEKFTAERTRIETEILPELDRTRDLYRTELEESKEAADRLASESSAWVKEQSRLSREIKTLRDELEPRQTKKARFGERFDRLRSLLEEQEHRLSVLESTSITKREECQALLEKINTNKEAIAALARELTIIEQNRVIEKDTQTRLLKEQRDKQRELDKLEATEQAQQEARGTHATQILLQSDIPGIRGLVASLGEVEPRYQLALEIAAGARLGQVVVDDDSIATACIALLKQRRAGRATFLPLNKIRPGRLPDISPLRHARGYIDIAVNLIRFHPRYRDIFAYVFGATVIFEDINSARAFLGQYRVVTLEGELLEMTGAMTGGSQPARSGLRFGVPSGRDNAEMDALRERLTEIDRMLARGEEKIQGYDRTIARLTRELTDSRQQYREDELNYQQLEKDIQRLTNEKDELIRQRLNSRQELIEVEESLKILNLEIPPLEVKLQDYQEQLNRLENQGTHEEWQRLQGLIRSREVRFQEQEKLVNRQKEILQEIENEKIRTSEKIRSSEASIINIESKIVENIDLNKQIKTESEILDNNIEGIRSSLEKLNQKLGETKRERDKNENQLKELQERKQQKNWQLEKLNNTQQERKELLINLENQIEEQKNNLPETLPEIAVETSLDNIQNEIKQINKKLEALEPVNMLALEEYRKTKERLDELSEKLTTLEGERTELLLRIENFTTLRLKAFQEAFDAVNENFKIIFAALSDGDGYLQLDDEEDPFNGGLNLVAHPKGKPVQRLSSMSGGEKSLTALSFIFSLQRYRPSPFYAFDEVDMFLDGANVEKLAGMIQKQALQAQFIVVSLRRPMIEASTRTIGVTQARGTHTQVLGIKV